MHHLVCGTFYDSPRKQIHLWRYITCKWWESCPFLSIYISVLFSYVSALLGISLRCLKVVVIMNIYLILEFNEMLFTDLLIVCCFLGFLLGNIYHFRKFSSISVWLANSIKIEFGIFLFWPSIEKIIFFFLQSCPAVTYIIIFPHAETFLHSWKKLLMMRYSFNILLDSIY